MALALAETDLLRLEKRHRVHADMLADDELHAREADPGLRLHGYPECHFRGADIHHDRGTRLLEVAHWRSRDVEGNRSLIDAANIAFGAADRDICPGLELLGRVRRAHHCGNSQFPSHDGRMAGPAALVGDDTGRDLHDRLPIRTGGRRDQNLARFERCEVTRCRNAPRAPGGDLFTYRAAGDDNGRTPLESIGLVDIGRTLRGNRLGTRLNNIDLAVGAILCPFDIHWHGNTGVFRIVLLDPHGNFGKAQHLRIGNAEPLPFGAGHVANAGRAAAAALAVSHAYLLAAESTAQDTAKPLFQGRLVNVELVRIDTALDDGFAETVTTRDENHIAKSRFGIEREGDATGREIRADHLHHSDGEGDLEVIEAIVDAVGNRAIGKNGGKATPAGLEQILRAADVEEAFMLARKTRGRQIFCRRRTSHGDCNASPVFPFKLPIRFQDLRAERLRIHCHVYDFAGLGGDGGKPLDLALVETVEKSMKLVRDTGLRQRIAVSVCRDGKTVGDSNPLRRENGIQLAKRRGLAADQADVVQANFEERPDISRHLANRSRRTCSVLRKVKPSADTASSAICLNDF